MRFVMSVQNLYGLILNRDVTDDDLHETIVDRILSEKFAGKHRGSVRISTGRFYTQQEWKDRRAHLLKIKLR